MNKIFALFYLIFLEIKRTSFGVKYFAEVDVTDNCNLRCKHCYHFSGKKDFKTKELPLEVWKKRFSELHKKGVRYILLVGGEPALRNDVLMLADKIFPFIHVITNGTIKISKKFNHLLFVSLEGGPDINDSIRGKGVFSKVINNYAGDKRVIINMTLQKDNYKELGNMVRITKENGLRGVVCNIYTPTMGERNQLFIEKEKRQLIINELKRVKSKYPTHLLMTDSMIKWYEFPNHVGFCHWGDTVLHFDNSWKARRCFVSADYSNCRCLDCSNCGCLAGSIQNPLRLLKTPRLLEKFS